MSTTLRYVDRAVEALAAYLVTAVPTQLRAVELEQSLSAEQLLEDPFEVVAANLENQSSSPLVEVYDSRAQPVQQRNREWDVTCVIAFSFSGDGDALSCYRRLRRYGTAFIKAVYADHTLGGQVVQAEPGEYAPGLLPADQDGTRYMFLLEVVIRVQEIL